MFQHKGVWCVQPPENGLVRAEESNNHNEQKLPHNYAHLQRDVTPNQRFKRFMDRNSVPVDFDVNGIDWNEAVLCNSMGFSRFVRDCDDKILNILLNKTLFFNNKEEKNYNITLTNDSFVQLLKVKNSNNNCNSNEIYNFELKTLNAITIYGNGCPDSLFVTQLYNCDDPIFSARGMLTTSLNSKNINRGFARYSPGHGDYKNILINDKLLYVIAWDTSVPHQFELSFRRLVQDPADHDPQYKYPNARKYEYTSHLITPLNNNSSNNINYYNQFMKSNVNITEFGISLCNCFVFRTQSVSLPDLSTVVFDCVLLGDVCYDNHNNNVTLTLFLVCKALLRVNYCFEFIEIKLTFTNRYKNLLSCWYQHDTNVSINNNLNIQRMFNVKNECLKIKTLSHHIILCNRDSNNYVILMLNFIVHTINSNNLFPFVCVTLFLCSLCIV